MLFYVVVFLSGFWVGIKTWQAGYKTLLRIRYRMVRIPLFILFAYVMNRFVVVDLLWDGYGFSNLSEYLQFFLFAFVWGLVLGDLKYARPASAGGLIGADEPGTGPDPDDDSEPEEEEETR